VDAASNITETYVSDVWGNERAATGGRLNIYR